MSTDTTDTTDSIQWLMTEDLYVTLIPDPTSPALFPGAGLRTGIRFLVTDVNRRWATIVRADEDVDGEIFMTFNGEREPISSPDWKYLINRLDDVASEGPGEHHVSPDESDAAYRPAD